MCNTIVKTVFLLIMNLTEYRSVHNQKGNRLYDHIQFNLKVIRDRFFSEWDNLSLVWTRCQFEYSSIAKK